MLSKLDKQILSISALNLSMEKISFSYVWSGDAFSSQNELLNNSINAINNLENPLFTYKNKVNELTNYKKMLNNLNKKEDELNSIAEYIIRYDYLGNQYKKKNENYASLEKEISYIRQDLADWKKKLLEYFSKTIEENSGGIIDNIIDNNNNLNNLSNNLHYGNIDQIINQFFTNQYLPIIAPTKRPSSTKGLYEVYKNEGGKNFIYNRLMNAINKAGNNNRQKSVNAVVELFNLTTNAGIKLPYINKGAGTDGSFVTTDCVATGVDCNAFVCWAVDKGVKDGFQWRPCSGVNGLTEVGKYVDFSEWERAKPGDILSRGVNGAHSVYILKNYPDKRMFVIAEESGRARGLTLTPVSYDGLRSTGMILRDMDDVYSGVDQESRFNKYQKNNIANYSEINTDLHI